MADEIAGFPSLETGVDPIIGKRGSNQRIPAGTQHYIPRSPNANRVQSGQLPRPSSPPVGSPTKAQPLGEGWADSIY